MNLAFTEDQPERPQSNLSKGKRALTEDQPEQRQTDPSKGKSCIRKLQIFLLSCYASSRKLKSEEKKRLRGRRNRWVHWADSTKSSASPRKTSPTNEFTWAKWRSYRQSYGFCHGSTQKAWLLASKKCWRQGSQRLPRRNESACYKRRFC